MLAERHDIDAVVVITPSFLHAEVTVAALGLGFPVLCEKPMATTVEDANRMLEASRRAGKPLYIGFQKRFQPAAMKMHELAARGEIGPIQFVSANLFRGDWNPRSWKYTDPRTGVATNWRYLTYTEGSAMLEDGIHELDTLNWILNAPVARVMASGGNNVFKDRETIDNAAVVVDYESGARLSFDFSLFAPNAGPGARRMVLIGSDGVMQPENGKISIRSRASGAVRYVDLVDDAPQAAREGNIGSAMDGETYKQYLAFAETVRSGRPPVVAAEEGKAVIKLVLLAEKSLRTHRILTWNDLPA
jgi:predicted dehydrogenase